MSPALWWVTLIVGALTVGGAFFAARVGAAQTGRATDQRERAAAREEWFRRLQWATELILAPDEGSQTTGLSVLDALAGSPLASHDDLKLLMSLNANAQLDRAEHDYDEDVDATVFVGDNEESIAGTQTEEEQT